jgi:Leucine-rich repeat (LRR) protein
MAWLRAGLCLTLVISIAASLEEIESTASSAPCQSECSIYLNISVIDCSSCLCDVIPNEPPSDDPNQTWVTVLLSNNSIEFVPPLAAVYPTVQYLDLGHNKISSIADEAFEGLASLTKLILCHNNLTSFNFNLLRSLTSLNELSLESSGLTALQGFVESFSSNMKTLDLSSNSIATLGAGLQGFKQLLMLNLSHNLIKRIDQTDFDGMIMDSESELYLTGNDIAGIADNAFSQCCARLRLLDLTYNYIHTLTPDTFRGLNNLAHLDLSENRLQTVDASAFTCLDSLWTLVIELNHLESFTANNSALAMPTTLRQVVLLHTKLTVIENGTFANMGYLNNVTIAGNDKLTRIDAGVFSGDTKSSVRFLNISYNALTLLEADTLDWNSVLSVDASGNNWVCNCSMMWIKNSSFLNRAGSTFR